ncbi:unnamed protein product [Penicillium pancosmium]
MEYIEGSSMLSLNPEAVSQPVRQQIFQAIVEIESQDFENDFDLSDMATRNVMLTGLNEKHPQVVLIDFDAAVFLRCKEDYSPAEAPGSFLGQDEMNVFEEWVDWDWTRWLESEFRDSQHTITPAMREVYSRKPPWWKCDAQSSD